MLVRMKKYGRSVFRLLTGQTSQTTTRVGYTKTVAAICQRHDMLSRLGFSFHRLGLRVRLRCKGANQNSAPALQFCNTQFGVCPLWVKSRHMRCKVRFTPESRHVQCISPCLLWPKADIYRFCDPDDFFSSVRIITNASLITKTSINPMPPRT